MMPQSIAKGGDSITSPAPSADTLQNSLLQVDLTAIWLLLAAFLVFFMQVTKLHLRAVYFLDHQHPSPHIRSHEQAACSNCMADRITQPRDVCVYNIVDKPYMTSAGS